MSLNQLLAVATIVSLFTPLTIAAIKYRSSKPSAMGNAQTLQTMTFSLSDRLSKEVLDLTTKVAELNDALDRAIVRARLAEYERDDAYEALRDHDLPLPHRRPRPNVEPGDEGG